jgi:hypothetical protein
VASLIVQWVLKRTRMHTGACPIIISGKKRGGKAFMSFIPRVLSLMSVRNGIPKAVRNLLFSGDRIVTGRANRIHNNRKYVHGKRSRVCEFYSAMDTRHCSSSANVSATFPSLDTENNTSFPLKPDLLIRQEEPSPDHVRSQSNLRTANQPRDKKHAEAPVILFG